MRRGIIAALVCLLCVPAAVAAEPADPSRLLGTWESDAAVLTFNADGTAVMERTDGVIVEMDWSVFAHAQVFGVDMLILRAVSGGETGYGQAAFPTPDELALTVFNPSVDWDALAAVLTRRPGTEAPPGTELAPSLLPSLDPAAGDFLGTWQGEHNGQQLTIVFDADRVADFQAGRTILVVPWSVSGAVDTPAGPVPILELHWLGTMQYSTVEMDGPDRFYFSEPRLEPPAQANRDIEFTRVAP